MSEVAGNKSLPHSDMTDSKELPNIYFRNVIPTDLPVIHALEYQSYPADEAASRSKLQYRQHHAAIFFRCAVLFPPEDDEASGDQTTTTGTTVLSPTKKKADTCHNQTDPQLHEKKNKRPKNAEDGFSVRHNSYSGKGELIGFITATRCHTFTERSMSVHDHTAPLLAIHSLVVAKNHRNKGVGAALLKNYFSYLQKLEIKHGIEKVVLMAKKEKLGFYVQEGGFKVLRKTKILHGKDQWFECEREVSVAGKKEGRKSDCWVLNSFAAAVGGVAGSGIQGTGNPAAVVLVPVVLDFEQDAMDTTLPEIVPPASSPVRHRSSSPSRHQRDDSFDVESDNFKDPDHESTISWMKKVAQEFNLSETAFLWEHKAVVNANYDSSLLGSFLLDGTNQEGEAKCSHYSIRFYTRDGSKIDLCGHATLAASFVAFKNLTMKGVRRSEMSVVFHAGNGVVLKAKPAMPVMALAGGGSTGIARSVGAPNTHGGSLMKITMDFPWKNLTKLEEGTEERLKAVSIIRDAFFCRERDTNTPGYCNNDNDGGNLFSEENDILFIGVDEGGSDLMVELTPTAFSRIPYHLGDINFKAMLEWDGYSRGIILCCEVDEFLRMRRNEESGGISSGVDFNSRFFAPKCGLDEDPVTGSAHCVLGPYFATKLEKESVVGAQKSQRGGIVECTLHRENKLDEYVATRENFVSLSGTVMMVLSGTLYI